LITQISIRAHRRQDMHTINPKELCAMLERDLTHVRHNKIDALKYKISSGAYNIKSTHIAKAIVGKESKR